MLMDGIDPCIRRVWMFLEVRYCIEINKDTVSKECEFSTFKENGKLVSVIHCIANDGHRNFLYYNLQRKLGIKNNNRIFYRSKMKYMV